MFFLPLLALLVGPFSALNCLSADFTVISHRGLSGRAPEESKIAFELAADLHTDFLEMDIHRTKDNILIVTHDDTLERTTNIAKIYPHRVKDLIATFTFAEIEKLETGAWFNQTHPEFANAGFNGQKILKLADVIDISLQHPAHPGLYLETKSPERYPGVEKNLVELLTQKKAFGKIKIIFQSFDAKSLDRLKALKPEIPRLLLSEASYDDLTLRDLETVRKNHQGVGPDFNSIPKGKMPAFLKSIHSAGLFVHFWSVDDIKDMDTLKGAGADGIFTNRTDLLLETIQRASHEQIEKIIANRLKKLKE